MIILTILNTLAIIYVILSVKSIYSIEFSKERTSKQKILVGYRIILWKKTSEHSSRSIYVINIPIKNKEKIELEEEIQRLIKGSEQNRRYSLNAKISWIKTWEEVKQFEKDYSIVDSEYVKKLVSNFIPK